MKFGTVTGEEAEDELADEDADRESACLHSDATASGDGWPLKRGLRSTASAGLAEPKAAAAGHARAEDESNERGTDECGIRFLRSELRTVFEEVAHLLLGECFPPTQTGSRSTKRVEWAACAFATARVRSLTLASGREGLGVSTESCGSRCFATGLAACHTPSPRGTARGGSRGVVEAIPHSCGAGCAHVCGARCGCCGLREGLGLSCTAARALGGADRSLRPREMGGVAIVEAGWS
eukprot:scaffold211840_cov31-Tisochrysis_lutea.AAC.3